MKFKASLIAVTDMTRSRKFYEEILKQKVILDFGSNITFSGDFSLQTKSTWAAFINKNEKEIASKPDNFELYFEEEQFDDFIELLRAVDIQYVHDVLEFPWGQRVIRFYDPDMHIIEVGESMETVIKRFIGQGLSVEEIVNRTQHPIEFVRKCL